MEKGDQIRQLLREGLRPLDVAHQMGVALSTVHYHARTLASESAVEVPPSPGRRNRASPMTRQLVGSLLARGLGKAEVARRLGLAKSTVSYHARRLGIEPASECGKRIDWGVVQRYYDCGHSVRACATAFGFSTASWHQAVLRGVIVPRPGFRPAAEIFTRGTPRNRGHLKRRLLAAGIKDGCCETCGLAEWLGQPLSLALHHVNGDRLDNRVENLQLLCPNCHSQTENFAGRNGH